MNDAPSAKSLFRAISGQGPTAKEPLPLPLIPDAPVQLVLSHAVEAGLHGRGIAAPAQRLVRLGSK